MDGEGCEREGESEGEGKEAEGEGEAGGRETEGREEKEEGDARAVFIAKEVSTQASQSSIYLVRTTTVGRLTRSLFCASICNKAAALPNEQN